MPGLNVATTATGTELGEAVARVVACAGEVAVERIRLTEADGRVLAADLGAEVDVPACDVSAMDGFACRLEDTLAATPGRPVRLKLVGDAPAGRPFGHTIHAGEAVGIYTGSPIPDGADAIVRVEAVQASTNAVALREPARASDIRRRGEQLGHDGVYLRAGTLLNARSIGLAAAMGHAELAVARRPRVAVIGTGDEVVEPGEPLPYGYAYNANGPAVAALVARAGGEVVALRRVRDDAATLRALLGEHDDVDLVITTGGASFGRHDIVRRMLIEAGTVTFSGARIKPGAPVTLGALGETPLLALPGNPAAAWIVFQVLATVWFHRRLGRTDPPPYLARRPARAGAAFAHGRDKTAFWPARISGTDPDGAMVVERLCPQRAAGPVDVAHADVLAVTRPWRDVAPGGVVEVMTWS